MTTIEKQFFHRMQLARAKKFINQNLSEKLSLKEIARASGASEYHFIRVFSAYLGETPFSYIRRERVAKSLKLLNTQMSITDIALEVGFESASSFNKVFKKEINLSPREFRNLGKEKMEKIFHDVHVGPKTKEFIMNINMEMKPEVITRNETTIYAYHAMDSSFKDAGQIAWQEFLPVVGSLKEDLSQSEYLGVSEMVNEKCSYKAAISIPTNPDAKISQLQKEVIPASKYAKFLLRGTYESLWFAFDKAFKFINEGEFELGSGPCLEVYLNDPSQTPEEDLLTEILIPIK